jgi:hypothetical protein
LSVFFYDYPIKNNNYDFYLLILASECGAPFFWQPPLSMLAEFYLVNWSNELVWFDEPNKFYVAFGGDGAPFGKSDTACAWLVSILNLGKGIQLK